MKSVIRDLHRQLTSGEYSCRELVQEKITLLRDNTYHTTNQLLEESALACADRIDEKIKSGQSIAWLEGIPFGIKDTILLQGSIASGGSAFLRNYTAPYTATVIEKLMQAGAIPVVKENCDSFSHGVTNENTVFGTVPNAHDNSRIAGGSSGGSAVNVAKGYTVFSVGTDSGGAIPAGYNRIYGLKPTFGRVSRYGVMAHVSTADSIGPMASSLEDIRIVLNAMSGKDAHDQLSSVSTPVPESIFETKMQETPITVGYYTSFLDNQYLDATLKTAFQKMIATLSDKGIRVIPLDFFDVDTLVSTWFTLAMAETPSHLARFDGTVYGARSKNKNVQDGYLETRADKLSDETKRRITGGIQLTSHGYDEDVYLKARRLSNQIVHAIHDGFEKVNLILSPVAPALPPMIGQSQDDPLSMYLQEAYCAGFNLGGYPVLTAPLFTPTGIQLTANKNREDLLLSLAHYLEEAQ